MTTQEAMRKLETLDRELVLLEHIGATLSWDQQTVISEKGHDERAVQMAWIQGRHHELATSEAMGELLAKLGADEQHPEGGNSLDGTADDPETIQRNKALVRIRYEAWDKERKLPASLVEKLAETTGKAHSAWVKARKECDWSLFKPLLGDIVSLVQEKAVCYGGKPKNTGYSAGADKENATGKDEKSLYDVLLDEYEPGMDTATVASLFKTMKHDLQDLLADITRSGQPDDSFLYESYPVELQDKFGKEILRDMGFDFSRGSMGLAAHPFTSTIGCDDIRITTRYTEPSVSSPLFSTIHEGGHALYEQGASNPLTHGTNLANGASFAFHESQSRLWENIIGHSPAFWEHYYPRFKQLFPNQTAGIDLRTFTKGINKVVPSMIRVNADEVTYGLHIILRFELEQVLIEGTATLDELPELWDEKMVELLGIRPQTTADGVLQDVHWAGGDFGYFPTYALGNLYGAQIWETLCRSLGGVEAVDDLLRQGDLKTIGSWLNEHIYQYGMMYRPSDLLARVTGRPLDAGCFTRYLDGKYRHLYGF